MEKNFPPLLNDNIIKAAKGEVPDRIPVWIMRQAGRYLPEFREYRQQYSFFELVNDPVLAMKITLLPTIRYDLDAAVIFSDILVVPQAVGMEVKMEPGVGPVLPNPLKTPFDMVSLKFQNPDYDTYMGGTLNAISLTRVNLQGKMPVIGFVGAPWTLMSYMIEGGGSKTMSKSKRWLYAYPEDSKKLLEDLCTVCINYLFKQVMAGAQLLQVFESHAEYLNLNLFREFIGPVLKRIPIELKKSLKAAGMDPVPIIIFAKGGHYALDDLGTLGYDVVSIDWTIEPQDARKRLGPNITIQGNLDPCALYGSKDSIIKNTKEMIKKMGTSRYICNLGHGIYPDIPTDGVETFIQCVHTYSPDDT